MLVALITWSFLQSSSFGLSVPRNFGNSLAMLPPSTGTTKTGMVVDKMAVTDEPIVDKILREFFAKDDTFQVSRKVVDSFMKNNLSRRVGEESILTKIKYEDCDTSVDMFQPIYQPLKASIEGLTKTSLQKRRLQSFKLQIAYKGKAFCGWQIQPNNEVPSIQQTLMDCLDPLLNSDFKKPIDIRVCGRTDAGVSAVGQYCRVRTLRSEEEVRPGDIQEAINQASVRKEHNSTHNGGPSLICTSVERVSDKFHPTFDAKCRAYLYLIDADPLLAMAKNFDEDVQLEEIVLVIDSMLQNIQGRELDYLAFSYGKVKTENTLCTLVKVHACIVETGSQRALGIELVGDRFLRRMVRILVGKANNIITKPVLTAKLTNL